ncbi:MAG: hypothetical protein K9M19_05605 [Candidatus Marinimicrobia bacterium]|nr:hypothetical protein [Candidatus Neomarinimicrobiota bacterium]
MLILKKIPLFHLSPALPVSRMAQRLFPVILLLSLMTSCQEPPPPKPEPYPNTVLHLEALQVNSIEAALKITLTNLDSLTGDTLPIVLKRDGTAVQAFNFIPPDTSLWDEGLEPDRTYTYTAYRQSVHNSARVDSSNSISLTTMDTTSHDFSFETFTFGGEVGTGSSSLYDVAIINENNIWAVGEIYVPDPDSSWNGTGWKDYSVAQWDGEEWNLKVLQAGSENVHPRGIWAFSENDIWFASGSIYHWDGENTSLEWLRDISSSETVEKIWGSSPENIYFVGNEGTIVHYDGSDFTRLESGTEQTIQDIWGIRESNTGEEFILCAVSHPLGYGERKILRILPDKTIDTLPWPSSRWANSIWFNQKMEIFSCGTGVLRYGYDEQWHELAGETITPAFTESIRGQHNNDIFIVGDYGVVVHYNGLHFKRYTEVPNALYQACSYRDDMMVAVGQRSGRAVILRMSR